MRARVELALAALRLIQNTPPDNLQHLAARRQVVPAASWSVYDLARALTDPAAVWHQLVGCEREALEALDGLNKDGAAVDIPESLTTAPGLVFRTDSGTWDIWPDVAHCLDTHHALWRTALTDSTDMPQPTTPASPPEPVSARDELPRLIDALAAVAWVVEGVSRHRPTTRLGTPAWLAKTLTARDSTRQADALDAATWAIEGGLCVHESGSWWVTASGQEFLGEDTPGQLVLLVEKWWRLAPPGVIDILISAPHPPSIADTLAQLAARFPLADRALAEAWLRRGEVWGMFSAGVATDFLEARVANQFSAPVVSEHLPPAHASVYPDGVDALVSAGPLTREVSNLLRTIAIETRGGMSPRYVIDSETLLRTLSSTDANTLLTSLDRVIVGGVSDHLRHTITDTATRASSLTVTGREGGTEVTCQDDYLAELLTLDHKVSVLNLHETGPRTFTTVTPSGVVRDVLGDAGYPTFPEPSPALPQPIWSKETAPEVDRSWWQAKVAEAGTMSHTHVWWEEIIRDAISERTRLSLCVLVDNEKRWMVVEPTSLSGGRLRVMDSVSDVERTLPVSLIVALDIPQE